MMDEVRIEKPYGIESCSGGSAASLRRVQKVVRRRDAAAARSRQASVLEIERCI